MLCNIDINYLILYNIFINYYSIFCNIKLVNRLFNKQIIYILHNFDIKEEFYMGSYIKDWRPELDQTSYIYSNFIISNNLNIINDWNNKKIQYYSESNSSLNTEIIIFNTQETYLNYNFIDKYSNDFKNIIKKNDNNEYYIYYLYEDLKACYGIKFIVLPYFNDLITKKENFLHYNKIKLNEEFNHNLNISINTIKF